jgi:hypothetical protein
VTAKRTECTILIALELFIGVGALVGTVGLLGGYWAQGLTVEMLHGSPFTDYVIPALALLILVGGSSFLAATLLLARRDLGVPASLLAGAVLVSFEIVEYLVIGLTMFLQPVMFVLGLLVTVLSSLRLTADRSGQPSTN